jgi:vacuolar-type H+-ATPase subunit C/Vma6
MTISHGGAQSLYALITPIIESKKLRIVGEDCLHEILNSDGISAAISKIGKTDLGLRLTEDFQHTTSARDLELLSWRFLANEIYDMYENYPSKAQLLIDHYLNRYDVLNLKVIIRKIFCNSPEPSTGMPLGSIHQGKRLPDLLKCTSQQEICSLLHSLSMTQYAEIVEDTENRVELEIALEAEYFSGLARIARRIRDNHVSLFIGTLIDLTNVLAILRCATRGKGVKKQELLSEGYALTNKQLDKCRTCDSLDAFLTILGETHYFRLSAKLNERYMMSHDVSSLEIMVSQYVNHVAKEVFFGSAFTPGYILDYVLLREDEVRLVTTALKMIEEQIPYDACARYFAGGDI